MIKSIILAAGEGTRMKSKKPKGLHRISGKTMIDYVIDSASKAGIEENILVVGHKKEEVVNTISNKDTITVSQPMGEDVPYGTGFAVMQAKDYIDEDSYILILYGDTPLITKNTLDGLISYHKREDNVATVLTAEFDDPKGYGRIVRDENNRVLSIVEDKDTKDHQKTIKEINSGIYCFNGKHLNEVLDNLTNDNAQNEYYITDAIAILNQAGYKVGGYKIDDISDIFGVNSRVQLAEAEEIMRKRINAQFMLSGATIIDPNNTYIEESVEIGRDTTIYPGVIIKGNTKIGDDCVIGHNCRIENSKIGNGVEIQSSTIIDSEVDDGTKVGPYAYLRPNSSIGKNVKIGDFVEVKNATIGDNSKASHLAYIGDAEVGSNVNIGCGVVFVNYDGAKKYKTIVEDNAFVGSNSNLIAPVLVKKDGYIAAGSTITDEVPSGALSIARARQVNKEGWKEKNKK
ncbi:MAG: bifunctional UDP-N-acetylglucosamine diphosphorylase/glucosamine-1-phosphate N-acetyltransferase GlmU [Firmicutes bacterium]|nr:bifunctional UDP-N-acetylglucosamine diphosphorylase/glucosamine-1-phosphate N-acetyltransferase GlmU [Bacillota bacterium]